MRDLVLLLALLCLSCSVLLAEVDERLPNKCEVCKYLTVELQSALEKSSQSKEVLELGQVLDSGARKRKIKYSTSRWRGLQCKQFLCAISLSLSLNVSVVSQGSSETMATLKNLVHKGVKVELGIPYELWDEPSVEVSDMKKQCETMLEQYEEVVEGWYLHHQDQRLESFLCEKHVLQGTELEEEAVQPSRARPVPIAADRSQNSVKSGLKGSQ
ncbi:protein canopy 4 [Huso huso]|uniref:Protein canopy 4 n=1 Tax=Huso huso TaxID=61971 RepID=A0ABR0Y1R0_HUSHU